MNTKSQKPNFFGTKTDIKNTKKSQCPGPSRMNRTVQSTNHTNDNTKIIIIAETSTKTFFKIFLVFQSETCCETTLVTRYFFQGRCHVTQSNYSSTENIDAWHFVNCTAAASQNAYLIRDLHYMAKWHSPSSKYRRGFDLIANGVKIQRGTPRRCSYFQFVSFHLSNHSKPLNIPEI